MSRKTNLPFKKLKDSVNSYISKYPLPSRDQNHKNLIKLKILKTHKLFNESTKLQEEYKKLRNYIIISNGGFGMKYTIKYYYVLNDEDIIFDLFQEATYGIMEAVDTFDPDRGTMFTTHAFFYVRKCIIDFIKKNKLVKAPREIAMNLKKISEIQGKLFTKLQREPDSDEILEELLTREEDSEVSITIIEDVISLLKMNSSDCDNKAFITQVSEDSAYIDESKLESNLKASIFFDLKAYDKEFIDFIKLRFGLEKDNLYSINEIQTILQLSDDKIKNYIYLSEEINENSKRSGQLETECT